MVSRATIISLWITALVSACLLYSKRIDIEMAFLSIVCLLSWIWYSTERQRACDREQVGMRLESIEQNLLRMESAPINSPRIADGLTAMIAEMHQVNRYWDDNHSAD